MPEKLANIAGGLITVATVMVIVTSRHTPAVIREFGRAFTGAIRSATGRERRR